jgi:hypothetical protein
MDDIEIDEGAASQPWPELPYAAWRETCETLHLWTQIAGKVRLALSPPVNHWWHVPFYVTARGLTTSPIPYRGESFEVVFDFLDHNLYIQTSSGALKAMPLIPRSVAAFYREFMACLHALGIEVTINPLPSEIPNPVRCDEDELHASYDPVYARRFWRVLVQTDLALKRYRSFFLGKSSPVHFFWGSFDLALTFFSGRRAPERAGADVLTAEAYSHEVISCGFWPGNAGFPHPAFYSYTAPAPVGLERAAILPEAACYNQQLGEFLLLYDDLRTTSVPEQVLLDFFRTTYEAGATLAGWNRDLLERR